MVVVCYRSPRMADIVYRAAELAENRVLGPHTFVLVFRDCDFLAGAVPGQFVMLRADDWGTDPLLPRAFSILAVRGGEVEILIKTAGKASAILERALPGARFHLLGPLGTSFPTPTSARRDWLVAGGVGLAPLLMHAARAGGEGLTAGVTMFYGGRRAADLVLLDDIRATGAGLVLATEDGSVGHRGFVTAALEDALDADTDPQPPTLMACGPDPMLEAVARVAHRRGLDGYLSLEGEMACGIGACLACAVPCVTRPFRYTCVDGPVLPLSELAGPYAAEASA